MRLGFRTAGFRKQPIIDALGVIADIGYDGVEVCLENHGLRPNEVGPGRLAVIAQHLQDLGLDLASVSYHADAEALESRVPNTVKAVEIAARMDAEILIVNTERPDEAGREEQWELVAKRFRELCKQAEASGVTIAVEPEPGLLVHDMADMARLLEAVDSPALKINLDVGHCHITDDVVDAVQRFGEHIAHTHFEDIRGKVHEHLVPGEGDMDLRGIVEALEAAGYSGYLTIDLFRITDDPESYARRAFDATQAILPGQ